MGKVDDGGPAFPRTAASFRRLDHWAPHPDDCEYTNIECSEQAGMSYRAWLAGHILAKRIGWRIDHKPSDPDIAADQAVHYADALIRRLKR